DGLITEAVITHGEKQALGGSGLIEGSADTFQGGDSVFGEGVLLDSQAISFQLLYGGFLAWALESRDFFKTDRKGNGRSVFKGAIEGQQQTHVEKTKTPHEIEAKLGRLWIALKEGREDLAAGLAD